MILLQRRAGGDCLLPIAECMSLVPYVTWGITLLLLHVSRLGVFALYNVSQLVFVFDVHIP